MCKLKHLPLASAKSVMLAMSRRKSAFTISATSALPMPLPCIYSHITRLITTSYMCTHAHRGSKHKHVGVSTGMVHHGVMYNTACLSLHPAIPRTH
jgi:hypothetical protein